MKLLPLLTRKLLFLFFLGLPGLAFQAIGALVAILYTVAFCAESGFSWAAVGVLLICVMAFAFGAAMQALFEALEQADAPHPEPPLERAMAIAQKSLALLAMIAVSAAIVLLARGQFGACATACGLLIASCAGFQACVAHRRELYRRRSESLPVESPSS